ncbi:MAG: histidine kinase [Lunatimonas sp.]|uniref:sensor histidine kinase n=1 Tax=Lunatimonas sp. TaxID=2060141 RepID=UPI00263AA12D|nr:sensor histidine kinase [Lunatimonas sp.]MCC5937795.1 histidine kinase [Lunatimonas sp.]
MFEPAVVIAFTFGYLALLFAIAYLTDNRSKRGWAVSNNPYVYTLTLAVYCSAWTYYGSVGNAAEKGISYLAVYIGPTLCAPLWWLVMRKIIRISKLKQFATLADFVSARYGKDVFVGGLVTVICLFGIMPYLALQIKAITQSFDILINRGSTAGQTLPIYLDTAFYLALGLAAFTTFFGTRHIEATARREGLVMAVAFESVFKLIAFLAVGVFVSFVAFDGFADIFERGAASGLDHLYRFDDTGVSDWFWIGLLSMVAILFLPRQFHMAVIENTDEKHLLKAMWLFPAYLLLINLFVLPVAVGGRTLFPMDGTDADTYVLAFPLAFEQPWLAMLVYLGGFSAATSMIIVAVISLSTMVSNSLVLPVLVPNAKQTDGGILRLDRLVFQVRRGSIFIILGFGYLFYRYLGTQLSLVSIGLISFVAIAQLAPSILGGIYWKQGSRPGAIGGMLTGFLLWFYTLILPGMADAGFLSQDLIEKGPFGLGLLRPTSLLGMEDMSTVAHGFFFSLLANSLVYVFLSIYSRQSSKEHNEAAVFVDIFALSQRLDDAVIWRGKAMAGDLRELLIRFLGQEKTEKAIKKYEKKHGKPASMSGFADPALVNYLERLLSGVIGTAAAHIMVASVAKEEEISLEELIHLLEETQGLKQLNKELQEATRRLEETSQKLREANENLQLTDALKDEFISTVTHEMKTPITSIRAFAEILQEPGLDESDQKRFLSIIVNETERMGRLIDQVLDLERFDSGQQSLRKEPTHLGALMRDTLESLEGALTEQGLHAEVKTDANLPTAYVDRDRLRQVFLNLLGNATKFAKSKILVEVRYKNGNFELTVSDDGPGIPLEEIPLIFDKFYQAKNQGSRKPKGSGLGLPISKRIVEHHGGTLAVDRCDGLTCFRVRIPALPSTTDSINR